MYGNIFNIKKFALHDGPGLRTTVFLKDCPLNCVWCHNPECRSDDTITFSSDIKKTGRFSAEDVMAEILKDRIFYDESDGGVSFSGGEPMNQADFLLELLRRCKDEAIHTTVDTSGYAEWAAFESILPYTDLFLFDLKIARSADHLKYTGVSNELILSNLKNLLRYHQQVTIRIPVIPDITDTETNLKGLASILRTFEKSLQVHLLPYHSSAEHKYIKMGIPYPMRSITDHTQGNMERAESIFNSTKFNIKIGG